METVNVFCINDGKSYDIPAGTRLKDFAKKVYPSSTKDSGNPVLAALVDHKLKELQNNKSCRSGIHRLQPPGRTTYMDPFAMLRIAESSKGTVS